MNGHGKILDCTLRDGAYLIDKNFGDKNIRGIIGGLVRAGADYIEIGFLQNEGFKEGKTVFRNGAHASGYIPVKRGRSRFTVLADYSRYDIGNLDPFDGSSFDAVRACFFKNERYEVMPFCRKVKMLGYELFVQPVDIMGYSDIEIIELIRNVNEIRPSCFSIVDTFGSMYESDLMRIYSLVHHNLAPGIRVGFHSHNNMQMSSALSQSFLKMTYGQREAVVDATLGGMGRGAGNTPTELIAEYMVSRLGYDYRMDELLDLLDGYVDNLRARCSWGYSLPYFVAGAFSAHVNNISYLTDKNGIRAKDMRYILDKIGSRERKRYDYDLLEKEYLDYIRSDIEDGRELEMLRSVLSGRPVLVIAPGTSAVREKERVQECIREKHPVIISVNFQAGICPSDYIFFSNARRFEAWAGKNTAADQSIIVTSNVPHEGYACTVLSFVRLAKYQNRYADNSVILLLRLLDIVEAGEILLAGFDGYGKEQGHNYADVDMEISEQKARNKNLKLRTLLEEYFRERRGSAPVKLITGESAFSEIIDREGSC